MQILFGDASNGVIGFTLHSKMADLEVHEMSNFEHLFKFAVISETVTANFYPFRVTACKITNFEIVYLSRVTACMQIFNPARVAVVRNGRFFSLVRLLEEIADSETVE